MGALVGKGKSALGTEPLYVAGSNEALVQDDLIALQSQCARNAKLRDLVLGVGIKKTVIPVVVALFLFSMFSRIFIENGAPDYFLIWLACGVPFGIGKMFTLIPIGFGISGTVGVVALNLVLGGLIGGVILIWKLAVALWYLPLTIYRLVT